jgi:hypothetical protein
MERSTANNFVTNVHYTVSAVDENQKDEFDVNPSVSTYGVVSYTENSNEFIPFEQLTQEQVIGWVQNSIDKETIEEALAIQIEPKINPTQVFGKPWNSISE